MQGCEVKKSSNKQKKEDVEYIYYEIFVPEGAQF